MKRPLDSIDPEVLFIYENIFGIFLGTYPSSAYKGVGGLTMKDFKFSELILFGAWVRKRHPEMFDQLEDLYDEFYEEFGRFERNEKDQDTVRESSN